VSRSSDRSSPESEAWTLDFTAPASTTPSSANPTPTDATCSPPAGRESPSSTMSAPSQPQTFDWQAGGTSDKTWKGKSRMWVEDKPGTARALSANKTLAVWTSSAEDSPAKTSRSQDDGQGLSPASAPPSSSSSHGAPTLWSDQAAGSSLRTYPDFFPPTVDAISRSFSRRWPSSGFTTSLGECWTVDTSECPSGAGAFSSLRDVLQGDVPARYFLSRKAAAGILRRADKRGRQLPAHLREALEAVAGRATTAADRGPT